MDRIIQARENRIRRLERIRSNRSRNHNSSINNAFPEVSIGNGRNGISHRRNTITMNRRINEDLHDNLVEHTLLKVNNLKNCLNPSDMNINYQGDVMLNSNVSGNGELETISLQSTVSAISDGSLMGRKRKFQLGSIDGASCSNSSRVSTIDTPI